MAYRIIVCALFYSYNLVLSTYEFINPNWICIQWNSLFLYFLHWPHLPAYCRRRVLL